MPTQAVYQILAGYPDCNDAHPLRNDPLFQILAEVAPDADHPLAKYLPPNGEIDVIFRAFRCTPQI